MILYDGVCALCNGAVRWLLEQDRRGEFRFAALQSEYARRELRARGIDPEALDTMYLLADGRVWSRSAAALEIGRRFGGKWRWAARVARVFPRFVRDGIYNWVARRRYRAYGKYEACLVPPEEWRGRFLG